MSGEMIPQPLRGGDLVTGDLLSLVDHVRGAEVAILKSVDFGAVDVGSVYVASDTSDPSWIYHGRACGVVRVAEQLALRLVVDDHAEIDDVRACLRDVEPGSLWSVRITDQWIASGVWEELLASAPAGEVDACGAAVSDEMIRRLVARLPELQRLDLCHADLEYFPECIGELRELRVLEIARAGLGDAAAEWFLCTLANLHTLGIEGTDSSHWLTDPPEVEATADGARALKQITIGRWLYPFDDVIVPPDDVSPSVARWLRSAEVVDTSCRPWEGSLAESLRGLGPMNRHRCICSSGDITADRRVPEFEFDDAAGVDTTLEDLRMGGCIATQRTIETLSRCTALTRLELAGVEEGVRLDGLNSLSELTLTAAEPFMLASLQPLSKLDRLNVTLELVEENQCGELSDLLAGLPRLDEFTLRVGDRSRPWRRAMHNAFHGATTHSMLRKLRIDGWDGLVAPSVFLGGPLPNLVELDVEAAAVSGWADALSRMPNLRRLRLNARLEHLDDLDRVPVLPALRHAAVRQGFLHAVAPSSATIESLELLPDDFVKYEMENYDGLGDVPGTSTSGEWPMLRELIITALVSPRWKMIDASPLRALPALRTLDISGVLVDLTTLGEATLSRLHRFVYSSPSLEVGAGEAFMAVHRPNLRTCWGRTGMREPWETRISSRWPQAGF